MGSAYIHWCIVKYFFSLHLVFRASCNLHFITVIHWWWAKPETPGTCTTTFMELNFTLYSFCLLYQALTYINLNKFYILSTSLYHTKGAFDWPYSGIRIYSGLFQNNHSVRMSIKWLFHFWNNGPQFTRRKAIPLEHFTKYVVVEPCEFSVFLQHAQVAVWGSLDFLRDAQCY